MSNAARTREINDAIRYTMWSVFRLATPFAKGGASADRAAEAAELTDLVDKLAAEDVVVRGFYELSGLRADADVMVWWHAERAEQLQDAYQRFRRTAFGTRLEPVWSQLALHRPAEFNKSHVPAFLGDEEPRAFVCVYPFVRSYDWYLLEEPERRAMLAEHGQMARELPRRARQHRGQLRPRRLRVDAGLRGRRAAPHRRPDAAPARLGNAAARARGGAVLHRPPSRARRPAPPAALIIDGLAEPGVVGDRRTTMRVFVAVATLLLVTACGADSDDTATDPHESRCPRRSQQRRVPSRALEP